VRGVRHLHELAGIVAGGDRAALVFVAAHGTTTIVAPDRAIDPLFADALAAAAAAGVEIYAYRCPIEPDGIRLAEAIPWRLA
jgi:sugar fermentation stimulation protein A